MKRPLDFHAANRTGLVKFARVYSNIVSPPVMFAVLGLALGLRSLPFWPGFGWAALYGILVSLLPILFVLYLLRTGRIKELHMSNTGERHWPYITAVFCSLLAYFLITLFHGPPLLQCLTIFNIVELAALALINIYWLISIHTTGAMATWLVVGLVFGWTASLWVLPLVISVCWVRLYLKRHTPGQVTAGLALGVVSVLSLTLIGCFN